MRDYHDREWGRPVTDEAGLYERLCLEAFQSGLSWSTILNKREGFRGRSRDSIPTRSRGFGARDVERLMADASIVRNRAKIDAAIANAKAVVGLGAAGSRSSCGRSAPSPATRRPRFPRSRTSRRRSPRR